MLSITRRDALRSGLILSASSLMPSLSLFGEQAHQLRMDESSDRLLSAIAPRERMLFDFGWRFMAGNSLQTDKDLGFGKNEPNSSKTGTFSFATEKLDDSKWRQLNLPHDWAVELPFVHDESLQGHGYKPLGHRYPDTSVGWYRKVFDIPPQDKGRRIAVEFDGVFCAALVFVNGCYAGRSDDGYTSFCVDISEFLDYGGKNYIVVRVDASNGEGWFYEGAGIYRHVWLTKVDPVHIGQWESYVRTEIGKETATLSLGTVIENHGDKEETVRARWEILDAEGKTVAVASSVSMQIAAQDSAPFIASTALSSPSLWSPETPYLYTAVVRVELGGTVRDADQIKFGVRSIAFDVNKGFFLNGKSVKIKGTCNHQDHAGVGAALPDQLQRYRLGILKEMGSNAVRTSHNMPTPEWVGACNSMGMMMMCETRTMSSSSEALEQFATMIKRYRNSPAIIMWSIGNEEWSLQGTEQGAQIAAAMVNHAHKLDPTRLCTAAINGTYGTGISKSIDAEGFNYNLGQIDNYHRKHPQQVLIGSETASTVATRGVYINDKLRNWVSAYDLNYPDWAETAEQWWKFYAARDFLPGGFAWTGFDYRGEPTPYGWPSINSQFGIVDMCGFPKDDYFYYKAWWGQEPVLHLFPHWNWDQRIGEEINIWVHSNLDEVELFVNGSSQGRQKVPPLTHLEWKVRYIPGVIEARGYQRGKVVLTESHETTGQPTMIRITADRSTINADGEDIAVLKIESLDDKGRFVPTADSLIHFRVSGDGSLLGVGNGDPNCQESDKDTKRSLFNGLAQVIVQSTKNAGEIKVEAFTEEHHALNLVSATAVVSTKAFAQQKRVRSE